MTWIHEGPDGPDAVEWWTLPGCPIGVTRQTGTRYRTAYVQTGEPAGQTTDYPEFDTLDQAVQFAAVGPQGDRRRLRG